MKNSLSAGELILRRTLPVIINSFNQYTYLSNLVNKLESDLFNNFVILDNNSTFPPLLDYYREITAKNRAVIVYYGQNYGPHYFHLKGVYRQFGSLPHLYTDPDLSYDTLADNFLTELMIASEKYSMFKVGPALALPTDEEIDKNTYCINNGRQYSVFEWESQYWKEQVEPGYYYPGRIDTTFHLYNPRYFQVGSALIDGIRIAKPGFLFKHLPWYSKKLPTESEQQYYKRYANSNSTWS
jgi:hypothetical protein